MKNLEPNIIEIKQDKKIQIAVFITFSIVWILFAQSAYRFEGIHWFHYLLYSRYFLAALALILSFFASIKYRPNIISTYCLLCMLIQSTFAALEGPKQVEFYQYVPYFVLISTLSLNGNFKGWLKTAMPAVVIAMLVPLFFKDRNYFESIGTFLYTFTTPVAILFLSFIVAKISGGRFEALQNNTKLQAQLLKLERAHKFEIENELKSAKKDIELNASIIAEFQIAQQVAHDIRSPLAALTMLESTFTEIEDSKRRLFRTALDRIRDIANNLIQKGNSTYSISNKNLNPASPMNNSSNAPQILSHIIDQIVSEKRIQYQLLPKIFFDFNENMSNYNAFSFVDANELKRVLSNLLDNAVESIQSGDGRIAIELLSKDSSNIIQIKDNGKGIHPEVLPTLGTRGKTFDKTSGSGLGIYYAKQCMEKWRAQFSIQSEIGIGTSIALTFDKALPPDWLFSKLQMERNSVLVIVDDDASINEIWNNRLQSLDEKIEKYYFPTIESFKSYFDERQRDERHSAGNVFYLIDYELQTANKTGINLIENFALSECSVLVTSRFSENIILSECHRLNIKILPKSHLAFIPIEVLT